MHSLRKTERTTNVRKDARRSVEDSQNFMLLFTCALWLATVMFALNLTSDSDFTSGKIYADLSLSQTETRATTPVRQQSTPANAPMRAIALEAHHLKIKSLRIAGGDDLLPAAFATLALPSHGRIVLSHVAISFASASLIAPSARAPPASV